MALQREKLDELLDDFTAFEDEMKEGTRVSERERERVPHGCAFFRQQRMRV